MMLEKNMEKGNFFGQMGRYMKENSIAIIFRGKVSIYGLMEENSMAIGKITRWMVLGPSPGLMEESFFKFYIIKKYY